MKEAQQRFHMARLLEKDIFMLISLKDQDGSTVFKTTEFHLKPERLAIPPCLKSMLL
jgi:hypothetical protein